MPRTNFTIDYGDTPFLRTSQTNPNPVRLNWRCEMLLTRNRAILENARVLDLASHDGRFSYACLQLGARSITGIEGRPHLVENARENLKGLGIDESRFRFEVGDIFEWLPKFEPGSFDVILCFGFLYHTTRQVEFFQQMERLAPRHLILDTNVEMFRGWGMIKLLRFANRLVRSRLAPPGGWGALWRSIDVERAAMLFRYEDYTEEGSTIEERSFIAVPTSTLMDHLIDLSGFEPRRIDWENAGIDHDAGLGQYEEGGRASWVAERRGA
jgi:SAM-dependent methyltransferase